MRNVSFLYIDNLKDVISFERRFASMVLNTAYGVDTFFVLRYYNRMLICMHMRDAHACP